MRPRRQHPNPRSTAGQQAQELTLLDVIASETAALKLAAVAGDKEDLAYTLANLRALVEQAQHDFLDDRTIEETAPGAVWRTNGVYTLPAHTRTTTQKASPSWTR